MKAKDLINILEKNPEAEVRLGVYENHELSYNVESVRPCKVEEDYGQFKTFAIVLNPGTDVMVASDLN